MVDFSQIRGGQDGQRHAFEELVCQLARRDPPASGVEFRRVEGSGGDGGVEAYWLLTSGEKIGYQAKYFLRSGDIGWAQIDESVEQALKTHSTLSKYIVALPCDLTDRSGAKGRGRTGWESWERRKEEWQRKWLTPTGRVVEFELWVASNIRDRITSPKADGLRRYWFSKAEFTNDWFKRHLDLAISTLDERFHPEDHVDVNLQNLFDFITRDEKVVTKIASAISEIRNAAFPDRRLRGHEPSLPAELIDSGAAARERLLEIAAELNVPNWMEWDADRWVNDAESFMTELGKIQEYLWKKQQEENVKDRKSDISKEDINFVLHVIYKLRDVTEAFRNIVGGKFVAAERSRSVLIAGRAGTGKSHLLGNIAQRAIEEGRPAVMLLGQQFSQQPLWSQIAPRLEMEGLGADAILQALDAAAEAAGTRALLLIDAINEGAGATLWRSEISEFLARIKTFPNLACVISCRTEYVEYVFPEGVLKKIDQLTIRGFETPEEQLRAARIYMDRRGIARPSTPWIAPEFVNPLFLRSVCLALQRDGKSEFPKGLHGTKEVLGFYLSSVARNLGAGRDGSNDFVQPTVSALRSIAKRMADDRVDFVPLGGANEAVACEFKAFSPPMNQSWFEVLERNGLLRKDVDPTVNLDDPLALAADVVRFSFQRFQDHLMAESLLDVVSDIGAALVTGGPVAFIHDGKMLNGMWQGLIEALSIQIPEKFALEFLDALPGKPEDWWDDWRLQDAFAESVRWRNKHAFSDRTLELLNWLQGTHIDILGLLIELSASIEHP